MSEAEATTAPRKRRWFAFSLRTMLVAVSLVAITLVCGLALRARADRLFKRAIWHDEQASLFSLSAKTQTVSGYIGAPGTQAVRMSEERELAEQAKADDHKSMAAKCRQAIWRPWIQVGPPNIAQPVAPRPVRH